jgi:hypothetical protein
MGGPMEVRLHMRAIQGCSLYSKVIVRILVRVRVRVRVCVRVRGGGTTKGQ